MWSSCLGPAQEFSGSLQSTFLTGPPCVRFIGSSLAVEGLKQEIELASRCDAKVLITGESGVGKEVAARLIHDGSARRNARFCAVNCGGIPDSLLESELFGHARGSFTGAYRDKPGLLELANHGTLFMDEVCEMSLRMQVLLLRFLDTGEIQQVGSEQADGGWTCASSPRPTGISKRGWHPASSGRICISA